MYHSIDDELNYLHERKDRVIDKINSCFQSGERVPEYWLHEYNDLVDDLNLMYRDLKWSVIKKTDQTSKVIYE